MSFWDAHFLWLEVVIASAAVAAATAAVGIHTTLRRVVFLPAAVSQLAGAGVVVAFLLAHMLAGYSAFQSPTHCPDSAAATRHNDKPAIAEHGHDFAPSPDHGTHAHEAEDPSVVNPSVGTDDGAIPMADDPGVFSDDGALPMADEPGVFSDDGAIPMPDDPGVSSDSAVVPSTAPLPRPGLVPSPAVSQTDQSVHPCEETWSLPWLMALLFACGGALALGFVREGRQATKGWIMGAVFITASATVLLLGGLVQQEMHDVNDVLFGNAIALSQGQMWQALVVSVLVLALHLWLAPLFLSYAFDPVTARAHGFPVRLLDSVLFLSMGLAIAAGTRVVGALPEFAFAVFPGMTALRLVRRARWLVVVSAVLGAAIAFLGYWISFEWALPTGATMAVAALAVYLPVQSFERIRAAIRTEIET